MKKILVFVGLILLSLAIGCSSEGSSTSLNAKEKTFVNNFNYYMLPNFKDPSSVSIREIISYDGGKMVVIKVAANNSFGGTRTDSYCLATTKINNDYGSTSAGTYLELEIVLEDGKKLFSEYKGSKAFYYYIEKGLADSSNDMDVSKINKAIADYVKEKGW